jgi:hypothetical protein
MLTALPPTSATPAPPIRIFPSVWMAMVLILPCTAVATNVASSVPVAFRRTSAFRAVPLYSVKVPPTRILPSGCRAMACTALLKPVPLLKVLSKDPLLFRRTMLPTTAPSYSVKKPPIRILPLDSGTIAITRSSAPRPVANEASTLPPCATTLIGISSNHRVIASREDRMRGIMASVRGRKCSACIHPTCAQTVVIPVPGR